MVYKKYLSNINNYFTLQNNKFGVFIQFYMNCNYKMSAINIYNQYTINIFFHISSIQALKNVNVIHCSEFDLTLIFQAMLFR